MTGRFLILTYGVALSVLLVWILVVMIPSRAAVSAQRHQMPEMNAIGFSRSAVISGQALTRSIYLPVQLLQPVLTLNPQTPIQNPAEPAENTSLVWDPRLTQRGALLIRVTPTPGQGFWRLIRGDWLDADESEGRHHIFVDMLNINGERQTGVPLTVGWPEGDTALTTEAKPGEPYAANFAMFSIAPAYSVSPNDGNAADLIDGLGMGSIEEPHLAVHTSYQFTWQWTLDQEQVAETPSVTPTFTLTFTRTPAPLSPTAQIGVTPSNTATPVQTQPLTITPPFTGTFAPSATPSPTATETPVPTADAPSELHWDPRLDQRGAVLIPAQPDPGQGYWRLIRAEWQDEEESGGRHHIFVDTLAADGQRRPGTPLTVQWADGTTDIRTESKPGEAYAADFAMFSIAPAYSISPTDGNLADKITGLGMGSLEEPHLAIKTSYGFVWQWTVQADERHH